MLDNILDFIKDWYVWWLVIGFITGLIDLEHFYSKDKKNNITASNILDLCYFSLLGLLGLILFLNTHGKDIVFIKHKK